MILVIVEALSEEPEEKYCEENIQVLHKWGLHRGSAGWREAFFNKLF